MKRPLVMICAATVAFCANATVVDVVSDWGLHTGIGNAAANTAAVAARVTQVSDQTELQFPAGDYYFSDTLDLSSMKASGVTLSATGAAVLHSGITLGGVSDVTVNGLSFNGCAGPAIVANATDGLVVTNCTFTDVVGLYTDGKKYNFAFVNVTGLNVIDSTYSFSDAHLDGRAYFDGGTQEKLSEAYDGATVIRTRGDVIWTVVTNGLGLTAESFNGKTLRKTGLGRLHPEGLIRTLGVTDVEILQGNYYVAGDSYCGANNIHVHPEGHLWIDGGNSTRISSRWVYLSGSGGTVNSSTATVRFMGTTYWGKAKDISWYLKDDASIYIEKTGTFSTGVFYQGGVYLNGHTLTISRNESGATCAMSSSCQWHGGGTVVVDKVKFSSESGSYTIGSGSAPKFIFKNGAVFAPADTTACNIFKDCEFDYGTQIAPSAVTMLTFDSLTGVPTVTANATSITVNNLYTARASDILAGRVPAMNGSLVFGANSKWAVQNIGTLERAIYTLWNVTGGVSGTVKRIDGADYKGWRTYLEGTAFRIDGRVPGLTIKLL